MLLEPNLPDLGLILAPFWIHVGIQGLPRGLPGTSCNACLLQDPQKADFVIVLEASWNPLGTPWATIWALERPLERSW